MRGLLVMGIPYQHAPEVSIVRTDTCMCISLSSAAQQPKDHAGQDNGIND
jgi:hypothetical protein